MARTIVLRRYVELPVTIAKVFCVYVAMPVDRRPTGVLFPCRRVRYGAEYTSSGIDRGAILNGKQFDVVAMLTD